MKKRILLIILGIVIGLVLMGCQKGPEKSSVGKIPPKELPIAHITGEDVEIFSSENIGEGQYAIQYKSVKMDDISNYINLTSAEYGFVWSQANMGLVETFSGESDSGHIFISHDKGGGDATTKMFYTLNGEYTAKDEDN